MSSAWCVQSRSGTGAFVTSTRVRVALSAPVPAQPRQDELFHPEEHPGTVCSPEVTDGIQGSTAGGCLHGGSLHIASYFTETELLNGEHLHGVDVVSGNSWRPLFLCSLWVPVHIQLGEPVASGVAVRTCPSACVSCPLPVF